MVELTALLREGPGGDQLATWPQDLRVICRREKPHPGAQLSLFEQIDGWRYQLLATNTSGQSAQFLEARHRPHARVEDNIRTGKQTGLGHLPSTSIGINRAWCLAATIAADLLCRLRLLCLDGPLVTAEPKTLRYRLAHTAASIIRGQHKRKIRIPKTWPWLSNSPPACAPPSPCPHRPHVDHQVPVPDQRNYPELWKPAPTRGEGRASSLTTPDNNINKPTDDQQMRTGKPPCNSRE